MCLCFVLGMENAYGKCYVVKEILRCQLGAAGINWSFEWPITSMIVCASAGGKMLNWQSGLAQRK